ncbi:MAG: trigger factor [Calditrichaceae bacterium]
MVSSEVKKISSCRKELNIKMDKSDLEPLRVKETKQVQKEVQYPGFRKGKAPLSLVKRQYADAIEAYTLEAAVQEALQQSVEEHKIDVVGTPEAKKVEYNKEGNLEIVIDVDTYPEIELNGYKGFEFTKDKYEITDKFVDETIGKLLKEKATRVPVENAIENSHIVTLDMQELDSEGKPVVGRKYKDIQVSIGEGRFDPDLEEQLLGLKNGDTKTISKTYPEDFPQKEMAGKKESYSITIKNVLKEELPELNEEFVKELGGEMQTVDDLRKFTRERLEHDYQHEADARFAQELSQKLLDENPFDVPKALIENYLNHIVKDVKTRDPKLKEDAIRQHYESEALFNIKWHYLKDQIAKEEKIEVEDTDIKKFMENLKDEKVREIYESNPGLMERVREDLADKKIYDFLVENSKVKDNEIKLD